MKNHMRFILIYNISYKSMISARPTCKVDEVDGLISAYHGTRYLVLFGPEKYDAIYNRIRSLKSQESGIIHVFLYKNQN